MKFQEIAISKIKSRPLRHDADEKGLLKSSIAKVGLLQPVVVAKENGGYRCIAGAGRLAALKASGVLKTTVRVADYDVDSDEAKLAHIDENFVRLSLTKSEQNEAVVQRKAILERIDPESVPKRGRPKSNRTRGRINSAPGADLAKSANSAKSTAEALGISERTVRERVRRDKVAPEVKKAMADGKLGLKQVDAIAQLPIEKQVELLPKLEGATKRETEREVKLAKIASDSEKEAMRAVGDAIARLNKASEQVLQAMSTIETALGVLKGVDIRGFEVAAAAKNVEMIVKAAPRFIATVRGRR